MAVTKPKGDSTCSSGSFSLAALSVYKITGILLRKATIMTLPATLTYKAVQYHRASEPLFVGSETLTFDRKGDDYIVKPSQILVKIKAAALNPIDLVLKGLSGPLINFLTTGTHGIARDYAGVVEAIGDEAAKSTGLKNGDRVCGLVGRVLYQGTFAEYFLYDTKLELDLVKIPDSLSYEDAAAFPLVVSTALNIVELAKVNKNLRVVVIGALTSVGRAAIQIARKVYGVEFVVGVCSNTSAKEVQALGAQVLDYLQHDLILKPTQELAKDGLFDAIIDCVGNGDYMKDITSVLKKKGEYVTIVGDSILDYGQTSLGEFISLGVKMGIRNFKQLFGLLPYHYSVFKLHPGSVKKALSYVALEKVNVKIDSVYEFDDYEKAVERLAGHKARGKVVLKIN